jgi:GNAT superfamily N-acetyltransferase
MMAVEGAALARFADFGLEDTFAQQPTPRRVFLEAVSHDRAWVAQHADDIVGFALAAIVGGLAHLDELDVHPDFGRQGLGRALVEHVHAWAGAGGFTAVTLTTLRDIPFNAPWYARLGYRVLAETELTPDLRARLAGESARGLAPVARVAMRREL